MPVQEISRNFQEIRSYFGVLANAPEMHGKDEEAIQFLLTAAARDSNYFAGHLRLASLSGASRQDR